MSTELERVSELVAPIASDLELDVYDVERRGGTIRVTLDTPAGSAGGITLDTLSLNVRARYPFVYLLTWEETRALEGIRELAKQTDRSLWDWSAVSGLSGDDQALPDTGPATAASEVSPTLQHRTARDGPPIRVRL